MLNEVSRRLVEISGLFAAVTYFVFLACDGQLPGWCKQIWYLLIIIWVVLSAAWIFQPLVAWF